MFFKDYEMELLEEIAEQEKNKLQSESYRVYKYGAYRYWDGMREIDKIVGRYSRGRLSFHEALFEIGKITKDLL